MSNIILLKYLFVLFIFIIFVLHYYQLECDCKKSTTATLRLVKQRTTASKAKSKSNHKTIKLIKLGAKLLAANQKYQSKFIRQARIIATSSGSTLIPPVITQPYAQPVIFAPILNSGVPPTTLIAQNPVQFKTQQNTRDRLSLSSNLDAQYANEENENENHVYNNKNQQDNQDHNQKVYTSQPVPMSPVPIVSASPIPVLTSAGVGNFPTTITYANANAQAIPNLSQVNSNLAHVPPAVNLFFESASGNPQIGGDEKDGDSNDEENYIVNGVDFTDNNKEHNEEEEEEEEEEDAEGNSEIKLDLDDQSEEKKQKKKKKTTKAYKIQTTFDKINEQLKKLNEQGNNNKKQTQHHEHEECHHHSHQLSTADYEEEQDKEKNMKEEIVHLVLHDNDNNYMEGDSKMSGFGHSVYNYPAHHQMFRPNHQIYQNAKQFSNVPTRYVNHDEKNCEDSDERYYKIKVKSPLAFFTKLFDKFIS